jgi:hypothetical protein
MRIAACLFILGSALTDHIFVPVYLLGQGDEEIAELLSDLALQDPRKETYLRRLLLDVGRDKQNTNVKINVREVSDSLCGSIGKLLGSDKIERLRNETEDLARQAAEAWMSVQTLKPKLDPTMHSKPYTPDRWSKVPLAFQRVVEQQPSKVPKAKQPKTGATKSGDSALNGTPGEHTPGQVDQKDILGPVWPGFVITANGEQNAFHPGYILTKEQAAVAREEEQSGPAHTERVRSRTNEEGMLRTRRSSLAHIFSSV